MKAAEGSKASHLSYCIEPATRLVRLVYQGGPSFEEWEHTMCAVLADPAYQRGFSFLVDRRADEPAFTDYVRRVIDFLSAHEAELAESRWAIVVSRQVSYGMARMKQTLGDRLPMPIEVFMDIGEAERWLRSGSAK